MAMLKVIMEVHNYRYRVHVDTKDKHPLAERVGNVYKYYIKESFQAAIFYN